MMTMTFNHGVGQLRYAPLRASNTCSQLRTVQDLVKRYSGYFESNPYIASHEAYVSLSFDDVHNANKFSTMRAIIQQPFF